LRWAGRSDRLHRLCYAGAILLWIWIVQVSNRIRGLLTQIHPALEHVVGPHLDHPAMLDLLERLSLAPQLAALS